MSEQVQLILITIGLPLLAVVCAWWIMLSVMKNTTWELKYWITPENLIKGIAIIFVTISTLALAITKIISWELAATILSWIIGYSMWTSFNSKDQK